MSSGDVYVDKLPCKCRVVRQERKKGYRITCSCGIRWLILPDRIEFDTYYAAAT